VTRTSRCLRYGGPWFSAASALPIAGGLSQPAALVGLFGAAVRRPWRLVAAAGFLIGAPRIEVVLSESAAGGLLRAYFNQRFLGVIPQARLCRGVLTVPSDADEYLHGRSRRALRNNLRRAAASGIRCDTVTGVSDASHAVQVVVPQRREAVTAQAHAALTGHWPELFAQPGVTTMVARDAGGKPIGVAGVVIDDQICLIRLAVASSHEARWALHDYLVRALMDSGVRYLLAADGGPMGALGLTPQVQYFQHLLGYDVCHIKIRREVTVPHPADLLGMGLAGQRRSTT